MVILDRGTTIKKKGFIWLPKPTAAYKITIERSDGTIDDVTDIISSNMVEDGVTNVIGNFEFKIWDPSETYFKAWEGGETYRYYKDYAASATTLRFRGQIEKPIYQGNKIKCVGRGETLQVMDLTVTKTYDNMECSEIIKSLFDNYATQFTYVNVNISTKTVTMNWANKPFWECVQELCKAAGFDCYIDSTLDVHFYESESITNDGEAIIHDQNMINVGEFGKDISLIRNRIIVYGAEQEGMPIIYTAEDTASQTKYGIKEEIVNDHNITSREQAKDKADYLLAELKEPPDVGEVTGVLLATIQPGEKIWVSSPSDNLPPDNYPLISYKDIINMERAFFTTAIRISKEPRTINNILRNMIYKTGDLQQTSINPHEMRHSLNFTFDTDVGSHNGTEITGGVLKLKTGDSGTWISPIETVSFNVTEAYLLVTGESLTNNVTYRVSVDNRGTWQAITVKDRINLTITGKKILVEANITSTDTEIKSLGLQYK